jgi:uncharacterized membrane protein YphA (DoxX/SURF4 family)
MKIFIFRYLLAALFIYAGINKAIDFTIFANQMAESPLIPKILIPYITYGLPTIEIILSLLLLFGVYDEITFPISFIIMLFFSGYLLLLYNGYTHIPCACGGILGTLGYPAHIVFNLSFTLIAFLGWRSLNVNRNT